MSLSPTILQGGGFVDALNNPIAFGYLDFELSITDASVSGVSISQHTTRVFLDASGNVASSPSQTLFANDVLSPAGTFYRVSAFTASGQRVWGTNNQLVTSGGVGSGSFNLGTWIPNVPNQFIVPSGSSTLATVTLSLEDVLGDPLANGYATFRLNQDTVSADGHQLCAGRICDVTLDSNGTATPTLWENDYQVIAYSAQGEPCWDGDINVAASVLTPTFIASIEFALNINSTTGSMGGASSIDTTGATLLVAILKGAHNPTINPSNVSDSAGNRWLVGTTYHAIGQFEADTEICVAYVVNPITSTAHTFGTNLFDGGADFFAFRGATNWTLDVEAGFSTAITESTIVTDSITPSTPHSVIVAGIVSNDLVAVTGTVNNGHSFANEAGGAAYLLAQAATTGTTFTFNNGGTSAACQVIAAFKGA